LLSQKNEKKHQGFNFGLCEHEQRERRHEGGGGAADTDGGGTCLRTLASLTRFCIRERHESAQNDIRPSLPHSCPQDAKSGRGAFGSTEVKSGVLAGYAVRVLGGSPCRGGAGGVQAAIPLLKHRTPD